MKDKRTPLSQIIKETQDYERQRNKREVCGFEFYQQQKGTIVLNGVPHNGTAIHVCNEPRGHNPPDGENPGKACRCACGVTNR